MCTYMRVCSHTHILSAAAWRFHRLPSPLRGRPLPGAGQPSWDTWCQTAPLPASRGRGRAKGPASGRAPRQSPPAGRPRCSLKPVIPERPPSVKIASGVCRVRTRARLRPRASPPARRPPSSETGQGYSPESVPRAVTQRPAGPAVLEPGRRKAGGERSWRGPWEAAVRDRDPRKGLWPEQAARAKALVGVGLCSAVRTEMPWPVLPGG